MISLGLPESLLARVHDWSALDRLAREGAGHDALVLAPAVTAALRDEACGLANASGGVIVLGLSDHDGARWLTGLPEVVRAEAEVRALLSLGVEPPFTSRDLVVTTHADPRDPSRGALVVAVARAPVGRPRACLDASGHRFWLRAQGALAAMTYAQLEERFRGHGEADPQRQLDVVAEVEISRLSARLESIEQDWDAAVATLSELHRFVRPPFGAQVMEAVFWAGRKPLYRCRRGVPAFVIEAAFDLLAQTLPLRAKDPQGPPLSEQELRLLDLAHDAAIEVVYQASRRLADAWLVNIGGQMMHALLRFSTERRLDALHGKLVRSFDERITWARKDALEVAAVALEHYRDAALGKAPEIPKDADWLIFKRVPAGD